jgi:hypothetical protein
VREVRAIVTMFDGIISTFGDLAPQAIHSA